MRPNATDERREVYECYGCGERVEDPDAGYCSVCGSEIRNIGRSRDL